QDADRRNVAAPGAARGRRWSDVVPPDQRTGGLVEREHVVAGGDREEDTLAARTVLEIERRREHRAGEDGLEAGVEDHRRRRRLAQRGLDEVAVARRVIVALEHRV